MNLGCALLQSDQILLYVALTVTIPQWGDLGVDYAFNSQQERVQISNFESPHFQQRTKSPFSTPSSSVSQKSWILMFQKQQTILQQLLEGQTRLEQRQDRFGDQLAHMTSKVELSMPTTSSSSNEGKRKRMVTRSLSVSFFLSVHFMRKL